MESHSIQSGVVMEQLPTTYYVEARLRVSECSEVPFMVTDAAIEPLVHTIDPKRPIWK